MVDELKPQVHPFEVYVPGVFTLVIYSANKMDAVLWCYKFYKLFNAECDPKEYLDRLLVTCLPDPPLIEATLSGEPIWVIPGSLAANDNEKPGWRLFVYPDEDRTRFQPSRNMYLGWPAPELASSADPNSGEVGPCG